MHGNGKPLETGNVSGRQGMFCILNKINYFSENVEL